MNKYIHLLFFLVFCFPLEEISFHIFQFEADLIFHLASINSNLDESQIDEELNLCKSVFKVMEVTGCSNLIFFSSIKVYGENSFEINQFTEDSILEPKSSYGEAKKQCEKLITEMSSILNFNGSRPNTSIFLSCNNFK